MQHSIVKHNVGLEYALYSQNYSVTSGSLWNYYRDEIDNVDDNASDSKSFKYKTKIVGKTSRRPERPGNEEDADGPQQSAVLTLNVKSLFHSNMLVIFGDFLIYH